jgi:hypothetical protein
MTNPVSLRAKRSNLVPILGRRVQMTRQELDQALARLGLDVPAKERDEALAVLPLLQQMLDRLRPPGGRDVAAEPAHVVKFPEG